MKHLIVSAILIVAPLSAYPKDEVDWMITRECVLETYLNRFEPPVAIKLTDAMLFEATALLDMKRSGTLESKDFDFAPSTKRALEWCF